MGVWGIRDFFDAVVVGEDGQFKSCSMTLIANWILRCSLKAFMNFLNSMLSKIHPGESSSSETSCCWRQDVEDLNMTFILQALVFLSRISWVSTRILGIIIAWFVSQAVSVTTIKVECHWLNYTWWWWWRWCQEEKVSCALDFFFYLLLPFRFFICCRDKK